MIIKSSRFFHFGIDPVAVWLALWINAANGGVVQGGSTITQQLATFHCLEQALEVFIEGPEPTIYCEVHGGGLWGRLRHTFGLS